MTDIELVRIKLSKNDLDCISEEEAVFFLQFGGLIHEVISLQKFIYMSSHDTPNPIQRMAENAQSMYFYRLLAGTVFEGWTLLMQDRFRLVLAKYKPDLDNQAAYAFKTLENYFSKSNLCEDIRNNFAYHYNFGKIRNMLRQWPDKDELEIYFSEYHGNCRYAASDVITNMAMLGINDMGELPWKADGGFSFLRIHQDLGEL